MDEAGLLDGIWQPPWSALREPLERAAEAVGVGVYLVGGTPRDLLLGRQPTDFDLTVDGSAALLAEALAPEVQGEVGVTERFLTASIELPDGRHVDLASTRSEIYRVPGALPEVSPASLQQDLERRDFSINTFAVGIAGSTEEGVLHVEGARDDLAAGRLRVLHDRSFIDDPTRLLRAVRLESLLGYSMDDHTLDLARSSVEAGCLGTVSGERLWRELRLILTAAHASASIRRLEDLGILAALDLPPQATGRQRVLSSALEIVAELSAIDAAASEDEVLLGVHLLALANWQPDAADQLALRLSLPRGLRSTLRTWDVARVALDTLTREAVSPSAVHSVLRSLGLAQLASVGALAGRPGRAWVIEELATLRRLRLGIGAAELLGRGVRPGPVIGRALEATRAARLDGLIEASGELDYALDMVRERLSGDPAEEVS